ncbi:MAG: hypothetical protein ACLSHG_09415 [Oscillospiraceae bacterium]
MSDNDHIDAQWLHAAPPPSRRRGRGCALSLLVLILVLAGVLFYPRLQAWFTPVPAVQIQVESSVLPDTAPNCTANRAHGRRAALSDARPRRTPRSTTATPPRSRPAWQSCSMTRSFGCAPISTRFTAG